MGQAVSAQQVSGHCGHLCAYQAVTSRRRPWEVIRSISCPCAGSAMSKPFLTDVYPVPS